MIDIQRLQGMFVENSITLHTIHNGHVLVWLVAIQIQDINHIVLYNFAFNHMYSITGTDKGMFGQPS